MKTKKMQNGKRSKNQDWAYKFISFCTGCLNDCLYCYAKGDAVTKKRLNLSDWRNEKIRLHDLNKNYQRFDHPVMFPSSHDITYYNFNGCCVVLDKLLRVGNRVLIVSKPRLELVTSLCRNFEKFKKNMIFRFTIGSNNDQILSFWEPKAPLYDERKSALKYAYNTGYRTSVSIEPMLDADNIEELIDDVIPFVNHSIWIGLMNTLWYLDTDETDVKTDAGRNRVVRNIAHFGDAFAQKIKEERQRIEVGQSPENLKKIYDNLKHKKLPGQNKLLMQWKSSIRDAIGLPRPEEPEQWPTDQISIYR